MRSNKWFLIAVLALPVGLLAAQCPSSAAPTPTAAPTAAPTPSPAPPSPEKVLAGMEAALNAGDVDAAMVFFTADAVLKFVPALPPGSPDTITGAQEIRAWLEELVAAHFQIDVEVLKVEGDTVTTRTKTWMDPTREMGIAPLVATEVYTFQAGKIKGFTWTVSDESLAKIQAAMAAPTATPAPVEVTRIADMVGVWEGQGAEGKTYLQFNADGTFSVADGVAALTDNPVARGTIRFEGALLKIADNFCDDEGSYRVLLQTEGGQPAKLTFRLDKDPCYERRQDLTGTKFHRVEP